MKWFFNALSWASFSVIVCAVIAASMLAGISCANKVQDVLNLHGTVDTLCVTVPVLTITIAAVSSFLVAGLLKFQNNN